MFLIQERVGRAVEELQKYIYPDCEKVSSCLCKREADEKRINWDIEEWEDFKPGDTWGGYDRYSWFKMVVKVPERFSGKEIVFRVKTGREGGWDAVNPQFMAYVDDLPVQGLDVNHRDIILSGNATAEDEYCIVLHAYSGMEEKQSILEASLHCVDNNVKKLYYDLKNPYETAILMDKEDIKKIDMLGCLNASINLIDFRKPLSEEFNASVKAAIKHLEENFYGRLCKSSDAAVYCVGHTHIDVAWRWTVSQSKQKSARSFSSALELMKRYPEFVFMSSQPQLYEFVKEGYPEIYKNIVQRVKEGKWEAEGSMWLEADCNLTSGESLVRQILFGTRFFEKEFGVKSKVLWMPDVFGYSAALPQIMKKSGIEYFMTTKLSWNEYNKFPYDTFMWKGLDGSEVLSYLVTTSEAASVDRSFFTTYSGIINPSQVIGAWKRYQQKSINNEVLVAYGYGDGGGGPTEEMLENARRLEKGIPGCPRVKLGTAAEFFKNLDERVCHRKDMPKWTGELYFENHRGTYTSMARNKKANRKCEFLYQDAEMLSVMGTMTSSARLYRRERLNAGWKTILLNQFHDILPGSSIKEVYDDSKKDYLRVIKDGEGLLDEAIGNIGANIALHGKSVVVFNQLGFERSDVVSLNVPEDMGDIQLLGDEGNILPVQKICNNSSEGQTQLMFFAEKIPSKGYKAFELVKGEDLRVCCEESGAFAQADKYRLTNRFFDIRLDVQGTLSSIYDKTNKRELLTQGSRGNVLQAFEDMPLDYDAWDINIFYSQKMWEINDVESIEAVENGPVRASVEIRRRFLDSVIIQRICIYTHVPRIDFNTTIDWKQSQILLKAAFPVDIHTDKAAYDVQFGNVERPTCWNTSWDTARFEVCAHKWADLSEDGYGISLMNDCKYGYDIKDGIMRITLLKSGVVPYPDADRELHEFTYSIFPHAEDWKKGGTVKAAYELNCPMYTKLEEAHGGDLPKVFSLIGINRDNIVLETVKLAEDNSDIIVRMYECHNRRSAAQLTSFKEFKQVYECDLMENILSPVDSDGNSFEFLIKPYEIKTFRLVL
ncbi:alpha-mannosidase [Anaerobacterium chartisolvens]|uniref:Alpha-mannosidase n=1 Tax=Anaerobacterium chartisolvens TaxID=1297424 RepID=A0A369B8I3_9FIRM|nr:alpha-mannosidase [Anaerobacterium chartisolvens]RCX17839.1 alpha-mannosidase [Anaerobacterium chartisolvens]